MNHSNTMMIDKKITSNPTDIAEGFNNYFSSVAEKLLPKNTPGSKHFSTYLQDPLKSIFTFNPTDTVEVMSIIDSLGSESSGPFSIPTGILQSLKANLCHPLTAILNSVIENSYKKVELICLLHTEVNQTILKIGS